jgi:hypothetical protein
MSDVPHGAADPRPSRRGPISRAIAFIVVIALSSADPAQSFAEPSHEAMSKVEARGDEIRLTGSIDRSTSAAFAALLDGPEADRFRIVRVNSTGGDARAAIAIASLISSRRMSLVVERICGSACAAYLLPAAVHARFEPGAMINLHHMASPLMIQVGLAVLRRREAGSPRATDTPSSRYEAGMNGLIAHQRTFYESIGVDPIPMESTMEIWVELHQRLTLLRKPVNPDRISFVPDNNFVQECLGLRNVEWRDFDVPDTIVYARRGAQPQAFLINGYLYFEGERISERDFSCRRQK